MISIPQSETKTMVRFYLGGRFFADFESKEVSSRNDEIQCPSRAYAYEFYDIVTAFACGEKIISGPTNISKLFFPSGIILDYNDVKRLMPDEHILLTNMLNNNIGHVILVAGGEFHPFDFDKCVLLTATQEYRKLWRLGI